MASRVVWPVAPVAAGRAATSGVVWLLAAIEPKPPD
jgi:hypothetical protein